MCILDKTLEILLTKTSFLLLITMTSSSLAQDTLVCMTENDELEIHLSTVNQETVFQTRLFRFIRRVYPSLTDLLESVNGNSTKSLGLPEE